MQQSLKVRTKNYPQFRRGSEGAARDNVSPQAPDANFLLPAGGSATEEQTDYSATEKRSAGYGRLWQSDE